MDVEDRLLQGAIELHAHGYPEFSLRIRGRVDDIEWAEIVRAVGMRAIVIKSQVFPTVERAQLVRRVVSGIEVFGGITLNHTVGGGWIDADRETARLTPGADVWLDIDAFLQHRPEQ